MRQLTREAQPPQEGSWIVHHIAGLLCCGLGLAAVAVTAIVVFGNPGEITRIPNVYLTVPFLVTTLAAGIASLVRSEGAYPLPIAGIGLACAALALGWVLVVAIIVAVATLAIVILAEVL